MVKNKEKKGIKKDTIIIILLTITLLVLFVVLGISVKNVFKKDNNEVKEVKVLDSLEKYGYQLTENNTDYYKKLFNELKDILKDNDVNDEEYAKKISQLFVADFYDLNSKQSKNDVGGTQYVYAPYKETFLKFATDSNGVYYYVESNLQDNRNQVLPVVTDVKVTSISKVTYTYGEIKDENAYKVTVSVDYKTNLNYPKIVNLTLIHNENKLEVVEMK